MVLSSVAIWAFSVITSPLSLKPYKCWCLMPSWTESTINLTSSVAGKSVSQQWGIHMYIIYFIYYAKPHRPVSLVGSPQAEQVFDIFHPPPLLSHFLVEYYVFLNRIKGTGRDIVLYRLGFFVWEGPHRLSMHFLHFLCLSAILFP